MNAPLAHAALTPSVAATLDVLAAEIELAGARCISLDRIVGSVMDGLPDAQREQLIHGLHGVDLLAQHLTSLAAFARGMSLAVPEEVAAPVAHALADVTLGALVERMALGLGGSRSDDDGDDSDAGDLDLF